MSDSHADVQALTTDVKRSWQRLLDTFEPLRPELYRYCRSLTRSAWEAEDLVQDVLCKAFAVLGTVFSDLPNPRAWLFRVASNLWIDRMRRARHERVHALGPFAGQSGQLGLGPEDALSSDRQSPREAMGTLVELLAPQERAALVLKDVFDFSLEEIALALNTTVGAVKSALHRGRARLSPEHLSRTLNPEHSDERTPHSDQRAQHSEATGRGGPPAALQAFCEAFNQRDLNRLTSLLLDHSLVEIVGVVSEFGPEAPADPRTGSFAGTLAPITFDERGGVPPELLEGYLGSAPRCEVRPYLNDWVLLFWYEHETGEAVRTVMQMETEGESIARVRNYFFTPEVIAEVCRHLQVPHRTNGYRYWV